MTWWSTTGNSTSVSSKTAQLLARTRSRECPKAVGGEVIPGRVRHSGWWAARITGIVNIYTEVIKEQVGRVKLIREKVG